MRVLVTGANGDIGEAVGRILATEFPDVSITGSDCNGAWPGRFIFPEMIVLPPASAPEYIEALRGVAPRFDLVIPTSEPELARLAAEIDVEQHVPLLIADSRIVTTFLDKYDTSLFFQTHGIISPMTRLLGDARVPELPLYVKPRRGAGGRGHRLVSTERELRVAREQLGNEWVAQQFLSGDGNEYTCALSRFGGEVRQLVLRRKLQGDRTVVAEVCRIPEVDALLDEIAQFVNLEGCINVQLKITDRGPMVFEINPRLSSTVMMRHTIGFRDCAWWVRRRLGLPIDPYTPPAEGTTVYRLSAEYVHVPSGAL